MKFDRKSLEELSRLSDEELWREIQKIATAYGIKLQSGVPDKKKLDKVRAMCRGDVKLKLSDAMKIIGGGDKR